MLYKINYDTVRTFYATLQTALQACTEHAMPRLGAMLGGPPLEEAPPKPLGPAASPTEVPPLVLVLALPGADWAPDMIAINWAGRGLSTDPCTGGPWLETCIQSLQPCGENAASNLA